jgi:glycosyltransferase involved in cell wall biosynthesis
LTTTIGRVLRRWVSRLFWPDADDHRDARVIVLHEWVAVVGGSDKVAARLAELADADVVYTFALDDDCVQQLRFDLPVVTWRFGRWAARSRRFTRMLPLMPVVWWALDSPAAELTVTSSHSCVNAARAASGQRLSYCHTPMRYAWEWRLERRRIPAVMRPALPVLAAFMRRLDRRWSRNVDVYVANSTAVADRIATAYQRIAHVVPPPIETERFVLNGAVRHPDQAFISAGRFVPYKRHDLAIAAANHAGVRLVVAGDGPDSTRLAALAGPTVEMVVGPDDDRLAELLGTARAFLFAGIEDFGMLAVEAQACGTPVIARRAGGAVDSVVEGVTGTFVDSGVIDDWSSALRSFEDDSFDPSAIRTWAEGFGTDAFDIRITELLTTRTRR